MKLELFIDFRADDSEESAPTVWLPLSASSCTILVVISGNFIHRVIYIVSVFELICSSNQFSY